MSGPQDISNNVNDMSDLFMIDDFDAIFGADPDENDGITSDYDGDLAAAFAAAAGHSFDNGAASFNGGNAYAMGLGSLSSSDDGPISPPSSPAMQRGTIGSSSLQQNASNSAQTGDTDHCTDDPDITQSTQLQRASSAPLPRGSGHSSRSQGQNTTSSSSRKKLVDRRDIEGLRRSVAPPSWQNEAADRPHRQAMMMEVARLLKYRKKTQPTKEWIYQLPHKVRRLEERLYRNAPSLEAYLDKATLKFRLKKLAGIIAKQFTEARRRRRASSLSTASTGTIFAGLDRSSFLSRGSRSSTAGSAIGLRDSITSIDSLRSLRESLAQGTNLDSESGGQTSEKTNRTTAAPAPSSGQSGPVPSMIAVSMGEADKNANKDKNGEGANNPSGGNKRMDSSSAAAMQNFPATTLSMPTQQQPQQQQNSKDSSQNSFTMQQSSSNFSALQRQQQVNDHLQKQLMENMRQQQAIYREMQSKSSSNGGSTMPSNMMSSQMSSSMPRGSFAGNGNGQMIQMKQPGQGPSMQMPGLINSTSMQGYAGMNASASSQAFMAAMGNGMGSMINDGSGGRGPFSVGMNGMNGNGVQSMTSQNQGSTNMMGMQQAYLSFGQRTNASTQQAHQLSLLQGSSAMFQNQQMMQSGSMMSQTSSMGRPNHNIIPLVGAPVTGGNAANATMPPPPSLGGQNQRGSMGQSKSQGAAKNPSGFQDQSAPLSPGSFDW